WNGSSASASADAIFSVTWPGEISPTCSPGTYTNCPGGGSWTARPSKMSSCLSPSICSTAPIDTPSEVTTLQPCAICSHETGSVASELSPPGGDENTPPI